MDAAFVKTTSIKQSDTFYTSKVSKDTHLYFNLYNRILNYRKKYPKILFCIIQYPKGYKIIRNTIGRY
jgi:hypothetical protein